MSSYSVNDKINNAKTIVVVKKVLFFESFKHKKWNRNHLSDLLLGDNVGSWKILLIFSNLMEQ